MPKHLHVGDRVNTMTLLKKMDFSKDLRRRWLVRCDCNKESIQTNRNIVRKKSGCGWDCDLPKNDNK